MQDAMKLYLDIKFCCENLAEGFFFCSFTRRGSNTIRNCNVTIHSSIAVRDFKPHLKFERIASASSIFGCTRRIFLFFVTVKSPCCLVVCERTNDYSHRFVTVTACLPQLQPLSNRHVNDAYWRDFFRRVEGFFGNWLGIPLVSVHAQCAVNMCRPYYSSRGTSVWCRLVSRRNTYNAQSSGLSCESTCQGLSTLCQSVKVACIVDIHLAQLCYTVPCQNKLCSIKSWLDQVWSRQSTVAFTAIVWTC